MRFNDLFRELMGEAMHDEDRDLFQQALEILQDLKAKSPNAYARLMARLNDTGSHKPSARTIRVSSNPEDTSWIG
jgi:hypothetical protein